MIPTPSSISASLLTRLARRTFYTWNIPTTTPRVILSDGSTLIHRHNNVNSNNNSNNNKNNNKTPTSSSTSTTATSDLEARLPPRLRPYRPRSVLTAEQIAELKSLRTEDPDTWTVVQLARKFDVAPTFVMRVAPPPKERVEVVKALERKRFEGLSIGKKMRAVDRIRRKATW
ncbi:mitochondrial ribosomal protein subunit L20-domain-containing protein [Powellomyces hirtus]|nr:mitochondrial ribosomal protein subunit L20-domain-containing protein [Powellomyces hirtus]